MKGYYLSAWTCVQEPIHNLCNPVQSEVQGLLVQKLFTVRRQQEWKIKPKVGPGGRHWSHSQEAGPACTYGRNSHISDSKDFLLSELLWVTRDLSLWIVKWVSRGQEALIHSYMKEQALPMCKTPKKYGYYYHNVPPKCLCAISVLG